MRTWLIAGAAALVAGAGGMAIAGFAASGAGEASGHAATKRRSGA
jgi:hypothetical protein